MTGNIILALAGLVAAWAVLAMIGGERQRRVHELKSMPKPPEPTPASQTPAGPLKRPAATAGKSAR